MSGSGAPEITVRTCGNLRVGVIAALWHETVVESMLASALRTLKDVGVTEPTIVRVPGSFELPVAARALAEQGYDALVALGVVVRGGTPHFDYVCQAATMGLTEVSVRTGVPIGFGVLTCDTEQQALDRAGLPTSSEDKGAEATRAALATATALRHITEPWH
jgi:6,7-dimethyl-8-ribityllumazine synthase